MSNRKFYYAFNMKTREIIPVLFDPSVFIYFDPVDEQEYDYPNVYDSVEQATSMVPTLLMEKIHNYSLEVSKLVAKQVDLSYTLYRDFMKRETYYYIDYKALQTRACFKKDEHYIDILTQQIISDPIKLHHSREDTFNEIMSMISARSKERSEKNV